jgi:hypothetical protein
MLTISIVVVVLIIAVLINTIIENKIAVKSNRDLIDNINRLKDE